jgi:hypothetical protein
MKSRSEIWLSVLEDLEGICSVSTHGDAETMRRRVASEGDGFFTVTLPLFGKELERALANECLTHDSFVGWARRPMTIDVIIDRANDVVVPTKRPWGIPLFLQGFLQEIFWEPRWTLHQSECNTISDRSSLTLPMIRPSSEAKIASMASAVFAVRQLTLLFSKEKALSPEKANRKAIRQYIEVDKELDRPL